MIICCKNIIKFGIKSVIILKKKNLTANLSTFLKTKIRSYSDEATDFHTRKYLKWALIKLCW